MNTGLVRHQRKLPPVDERNGMSEPISLATDERNIRMAKRHDAIALYKTKAPRASTRKGGFEFSTVEGETGKHTLRINGRIDTWEQTFEEFETQFSAIDAEGNDLEVQINSGGGDPIEAMGIVDLLMGAKSNTTATVLGIAASAASVIACACKVRRIGLNARFMIHNATMGVVGSADELRQVAAIGDDINLQAAEIYATASGQDIETIKTWMNEEKWMRGQEAVDAGFFSSVLDVTMSAEIDEEDVREFENAPSDLREEVLAEVETPAEVVVIEEKPDEVAVEMVSLNLSIDGKTYSMSVPADAAESLTNIGKLASSPAAEVEMKAIEDPLVASLKSTSKDEVVMTARSDADEAAQRSKAPASWNTQIAKMNANFGRI
jgi:ATP-dependent protease ClpP protease subunit